MESSLRKRLLRSLTLLLFPPIGILIIRLLYLTGRKRFHLPETVPEEPFVIASWHGDLLLQPFTYFKLRKKRNAKIVISEHFDGQLIARTVRYMGLETIHGSTTRGGAKVLIAAMKALKSGSDVAITPDGPKGPRHEVAEGIVVMAQKTKSKILVFSCVPERYWQFKSWDRFTIPKPFTRLDFYASEPLDVSGMSMEEARAYVKEQLLAHDY